MNESIVIWYLIVGVALAVSLVYLVKYILDSKHHPHAGHHHEAPISIGRESEIFYIPGDSTPLHHKEEDLNEY